MNTARELLRSGRPWRAAALALPLLAATAPAGESRAALATVPVPRPYRGDGPVRPLAPPDRAAIVIGARAAEPERYAAERLQAALRRKTGADYAVVPENALPPAATQLILLGQPATHALVARLCKDHGWDPRREAPGPDGYLIETLEDGARQLVLIAGGGPRGVIYGQAAFSDALRRDAAGWSFPCASVRDWPAIPWRAFAWNSLAAYLDPGRLDRYVDARLNFIELRDGPPPLHGHFGTPPDFELDPATRDRLLREARRRGFFLYGVVFCGVPAAQHPAVVRQLEAFARLGVDALYLSFDDPGAGEQPEDLVAKLIAAAARLGYAGDRLAFLPPAGNYQHADTPLNRRLAKIPGCAEATWFFTALPTAAEAEAERRIGLTRKRGWWVNWPIAGDGALSLAPGYLPLPPLARGWGRPSDDALRDAPRYIERAMVWVRGQDEYLNGVFGAWAWNPAEFDWASTERAVYGRVFGPGQVAAARAFDTRLQALFQLFLREGPGDWDVRILRLREPAQRPEARRLLDELRTALAQLEARAPAESALDPGRLRGVYLQPMRQTLDSAAAAVELEFPDYTQTREAAEREVAALRAAGRNADADRRLAEIRARVMPQLDAIRAALGRLPQTRPYLQAWEAALSARRADRRNPR